ncbi:IS110 family transposase [Neptunicoccus cionae]|uniref:IS110 family transposase n=1 Tax=Neptunicoccus cionae TaxID=2035344 RepID=UPI00336A3C16
MGSEPRIIPAIYVKPFNKGQKNDYNDAEAIAEAALRPNLTAVFEWSQDQLDLQALHRVRSRLVSRRTATINQVRAFLIEQGIMVRKGLRALKNSFKTILNNAKMRYHSGCARYSSYAMVIGCGWMIGSIQSQKRSRTSTGRKRTAPT